MISRSSAGRRFQRRSRSLGSLVPIGILAFMLSQSACYTFAAASTGAKVPGTRLAFGLTDRARADLAEQVGPGAARIEGTLLQDGGAGYVVSIAKVRTIDGKTSRWGGERITIGHDQVANVFERKFSRSRTAMATTAVVVGVTAFILTRNLKVFGFNREDPGDRNPPPNQ